METLNIPINAGETKAFGMAGNYIEVLEAGGVMDLVLYGPSGAVESARGAEAGAWMQEPFTNFTIKSSITQNIKLVITGRQGGSRRTSGVVAITNVNGAFTQSQANVTNVAGGVQLAPANFDRRYLLIQNRDAVANLYLTFDGTAPTAANGVKLEPGGAIEFASFAPTGIVQALSDTALASAIVLEG